MNRWSITSNPIGWKKDIKDAWSKRNIPVFKIHHCASHNGNLATASSSTVDISESSEDTSESPEDFNKDHYYLQSNLTKPPEHILLEALRNPEISGQEHHENSIYCVNTLVPAEATKVIIGSAPYYSAVPVIVSKDLRINDLAYNKKGITIVAVISVAGVSKEIRLAFLRKVYGLLTMQLLITASVGMLFMFTPPIREFVQYHAWILCVFLIGCVVIIHPLHVYRKRTPVNLVLLTAFVICLSITVGVIVTVYAEAVVLSAFLTTLLIFVCLSLFTLQTKYDYSSCWCFIFCCLVILIVALVVEIWIPYSTGDLILSYLGALLFCLYIIIDTSIIMKHLSPEEYITATVSLYLDVFYLFLQLLSRE